QSVQTSRASIALGYYSQELVLVPRKLEKAHMALDRRTRCRQRYHSMALRSRKTPPVGPSSGSVASHTVVSTPCSTDRGADGPPMSVRTQPGSTALDSTPLSR